jgi:hypothetical protein
MTDPHYATTVAEAIRAPLGRMLVGMVIFTIVFLIARRKHDKL